MKISVLGIDIAKRVFQLHGVDRRGKKIFGRRVYREELVGVVSELERCVIAMEACGGAHHWGRKFEELGFEVKLIPPQYVKPFVKRNKTDRADAEAICEAAQRPSMNFVAVKSTEQQGIQALHRVREKLISRRTAAVNEARGLLLEYGVEISRGIGKFRQNVLRLLEEHQAQVDWRCERVVRELYEEVVSLDARIKELDRELERESRENPLCRKLLKERGVGPIIATAVVAMVGKPEMYRNGRAFSASLGLTPRQYASAEHSRLYGISKRGNKYIRKLLIHGARAVLRTAARHSDGLSRWVMAVKERRGFNRAVVALANKTARMLWAVMAKDSAHQRLAPTASA